MMLVRSEEEESALMECTKDKGLMGVLEACGIPRKWGEEAVTAAEAIRGNGEWPL
jgi:ATP adenylyltransferase